MNGGPCTDVSCPYRTSLGYCSYSACINPKYGTYQSTIEQRPTTNYERIISKTPEELAEWIASGVLNLTGGSLKMATEAWAGWLKQEAKK